MKQLLDIQEVIGKVYKNAPHLPKESRNWLADNIWWLAIIGAILSVIGAFVTLMILLGTPLYLIIAGGLLTRGPMLLLLGSISLIVLGFIAILEAAAVRPLRLKYRYGWDLLFVACLISLAGSVINTVIRNDFSVLFGPAVFAAICFYILFEIQSYFVVKPSRKP